MDVLAARYAAGDGEAVGPLAAAIAGYSVEGEPGPADDAFVEAMTTLGDVARKGKLRKPQILDALVEAFVNYRASTPKAQHRGAFRLLNGVLVAVSAPSWEEVMLERLQRPIRSAKQEALKELIDEVYWQVTAAEVLGNMRSDKAIRPLVRVVLSPFKANIATTAINALINIGDPAVAVAQGLVDGSDQELAAYARAEALRSAADQGVDVNGPVRRAAERAGLNNGVVIVSNIGTVKARDVLLGALDGADATAQQLIAAELYKVPFDEQVVKRFEDVYSRTSVDDKIPPEDYAKEALVDSAASFFDVDLNGWIFADGLRLKEGALESVQAVQATLLGAAIKAATKAQWRYTDQLRQRALPKVTAGRTKYFVREREGAEEQGPFTERQIVDKTLALEMDGGQIREEGSGSAWRSMTDEKNLAMALHEAQYLRAMKNGKEVLDRCGDDVDCYLKIVNDPAANTRTTAMKGEKAAYMAALLGGPEVTMKLVDLLPHTRNLAVTSILLFSILRRSPKGDDAVADKLQSFVDAARASGDRAARDRVEPYRQIIYRLRTRSR